MQTYIMYAVLAGIAWGVGGYFEKVSLHALGISPILGITIRTLIALVVLGTLSIPEWKSISNSSDIKMWIMLIIGGGVIAGSLGMWSFYSALSTSQNLGLTLAVAFAFSPIAGTLTGLIRGDQHMDWKIAFGLIAIIIGIVFIQLARTSVK